MALQTCSDEGCKQCKQLLIFVLTYIASNPPPMADILSSIDHIASPHDKIFFTLTLTKPILCPLLHLLQDRVSSTKWVDINLAAALLSVLPGSRSTWPRGLGSLDPNSDNTPMVEILPLAGIPDYHDLPKLRVPKKYFWTVNSMLHYQIRYMTLLSIRYMVYVVIWTVF